MPADRTHSLPPSSYDDFCANWRVRLKDRKTHPGMARYWPQCLSVERMTRDQLMELQRQRLDRLLNHAIQHVPFYQRWAKENGVGVGDPLRLSDFPVVTKDEYRRDMEAFQSDAYPVSEMHLAKTSGSSGEPFRFRKHPGLADYAYACLWRGLARHGIRPGDRRVYVWGQGFIFNNSPMAIRIRRMRNGLRDWLNTTLSINAYDLSLETVDQAIRKIERFRPRYLHGYVSALYLIARRLNEKGNTFASLGLKGVITEAEKLYDFQRAAMEQAFATPVVEHYGSMEFGVIAQQDPAGHLRVNDDAFVVERQPTGEAVITSLQSEPYPFIRYKLGDLIEFAPQPADSLPYTALAEVTGRVVDLIPLPDGGYVHGLALSRPLLPHLQFIRKYQVRQTALDRFRIDLVTHVPLPQAIAKQIIADLHTMVGPTAAIEIHEVPDIQPASSGKYRWVVSEVNLAMRTHDHLESLSQ